MVWAKVLRKSDEATEGASMAGGKDAVQPDPTELGALGPFDL
jgi:hypothetical protein